MIVAISATKPDLDAAVDPRLSGSVDALIKSSKVISIYE